MSVSLERDILRCVGEKYRIKTKADKECFKELWKVYKESKDFRKSHRDDLMRETAVAFNYLRGAADGKEQHQFGQRHTRRLRLDRKCVVFSDHHMAYRGHHLDLFRKNVKLYSEALTKYHQAGFTLIEAGDVYELVIFNPVLSHVKKLVEKLDDPDPWPGIQEYRQKSRLEQLKLIIETYGDILFRQIADKFHKDGRYVLVSGNHDLDLQREEFTTVLRQIYPDISIADFVVLEDKGEYPRVIIAHGHQFDETTTPKYANRLGETISDCLGWAFEGADRMWRWKGDSERWGKGGKRFGNLLASGEPSDLEWQGLIIDPFPANLTEAAVENLSQKHEIAWEYFDSDTPFKAITKEVMTGKRFFKVRHLKEQWMVHELEEAFKGAPRVPTLVLGHTHEVRHDALDEKGKPYTHYANAGTAGRFENLIWGLEIVDGKCRVVSWHFPDYPGTGKPCRRVWNPGEKKGELTLSKDCVDLR
jgi:predicted phosphodiesterase